VFRAAQILKILANPLRLLAVKGMPPFAALLFVQKRPLQLIGKIAAGNTRAHLRQAHRAADGFPLRVHQSHAPFFRTCVASLRDRSRSASIFCLPRDESCSQCITMPI
jgi:hypothetical protein